MKLDSADVESRLNLAELFIQEKQEDQAVEELNEAAEFKMRMNSFKEADEILKKARSLNKDHPRTLENMIDLLKLEKKKKEALKLVNEVLRKDKENLKALYLLGDLCFEDNELKKAEEIKKNHGVSLRYLLDDNKEIYVENNNKSPKANPRKINRLELSEVIEEKCERVVSNILKRIENFLPSMGSGIVLTGGTSNLLGIKEMMEEKIGLPV